MKHLTPPEGRTRRGNLRYLEQLTPLSRINRKKMTDEEELMWNLLRRKQLGFKFIKQKPIGRFVLDFYCSKLLLAVEIDGGYHDKRQNYDQGRDVLLFTRGIITLRYKNEEVKDNLDKIKTELIEKINVRSIELKIYPCPFQGKGQGQGLDGGGGHREALTILKLVGFCTKDGIVNDCE